MKRIHENIHKKLEYYSLEDYLLPPVREFKNFIENEPTVYGEFIRMFEELEVSIVRLLRCLRWFTDDWVPL